MAKVSSKRQITLPTKQCEILGIDPGDEVEVFIADGQLLYFVLLFGASASSIGVSHVIGKVQDGQDRV